MHTELYCNNLDALDKVKAIRAIQEAHLQICAAKSGVENLDWQCVLESLTECLKQAGHRGYVAPSDPVLNSFQNWAIRYCADNGLTATPCGNWVEIEKRGNPSECMTEQGVKDQVRALA